ncbi:hypothetical protein GLAREA_01003 [Glarea lozoyensis ATCC 20868]|uniref:Uncharacterized protein n=1 Tax=Glarea lozoyensis (strain ATCC 20868 / MF5171) TaxID=1116229 RepID=S3DTY0_GLAL2|nr:uncharacterized protein GLAREA_01003 [Glarea lozoyensis ATCC 20868]EPE29843.1 hypothetical protein GLAREA_01003 [Glarea lozoyensis ATCC 20868]
MVLGLELGKLELDVVVDNLDVEEEMLVCEFGVDFELLLDNNPDVEVNDSEDVKVVVDPDDVREPLVVKDKESVVLESKPEELEVEIEVDSVLLELLVEVEGVLLEPGVLLLVLPATLEEELDKALLEEDSKLLALETDTNVEIKDVLLVVLFRFPLDDVVEVLTKFCQPGCLTTMRWY